MLFYKIACMKSFAERLSWAMKCAGLDPGKDQSRVANWIGRPCKPQNIQHLLDPQNAVSHTKYLLDLAEVLGCDPFWLGKGKGIKPDIAITQADGSRTQVYTKPSSGAPAMAREQMKSYLWPFKGFSYEEYAALDDELKSSFENIIQSNIKSHTNSQKHQTPEKKSA